MPLELELDDFFGDEITEELTYTPASGVPVAVVGVIDRKEYEQDNQTGTGNYLVKTASILINADAIAEPAPATDSVTFDGLAWGVTGYEIIGARQAYMVHVGRSETISKRLKI